MSSKKDMLKKAILPTMKDGVLDTTFHLPLIRQMSEEDLSIYKDAIEKIGIGSSKDIDDMIALGAMADSAQNHIKLESDVALESKIKSANEELLDLNNQLKPLQESLNSYNIAQKEYNDYHFRPTSFAAESWVAKEKFAKQYPEYNKLQKQYRENMGFFGPKDKEMAESILKQLRIFQEKGSSDYDNWTAGYLETLDKWEESRGEYGRLSREKMHVLKKLENLNNLQAIKEQ